MGLVIAIYVMTVIHVCIFVCLRRKLDKFQITVQVTPENEPRDLSVLRISDGSPNTGITIFNTAKN